MPPIRNIHSYFKKIPHEKGIGKEKQVEIISRTNLSSVSSFLAGNLPDNVCPSFEQLMSLKPEIRGRVVMMGKEIDTPRYVAHYIKPYYYTGKMHEAADLPDILRPLLTWANNKLKKDEFGVIENKNMEFNQVLVNFYLDGLHYIGKHSDDEKQLEHGMPIFSASFGETRIFRIREKDGGSGTIVKDIDMKDKSYVVMCGDMQKEFTHEVPKILGNKGLALKPRVNVTFRCFK